LFDGDVAVAWCEYGPPVELPNIYHRKEYEAALDRLPDPRFNRTPTLTSVPTRVAQCGRG
jgi:hypothetical protein